MREIVCIHYFGLGAHSGGRWAKMCKRGTSLFNSADKSTWSSLTWLQNMLIPGHFSVSPSFLSDFPLHELSCCTHLRSRHPHEDTQHRYMESPGWWQTPSEGHLRADKHSRWNTVPWALGPCWTESAGPNTALTQRWWPPKDPKHSGIRNIEGAWIFITTWFDWRGGGVGGVPRYICSSWERELRTCYSKAIGFSTLDNICEPIVTWKEDVTA